MSTRKTKKKTGIEANPISESANANIDVAEPLSESGTAVKPLSESAKANTVNGKRALYQQTAVNFQLAANEMLASGIRDMQAGVFEQRVLTKDQIAKFKEGAIAFQSGVAEMTSSIAEQIKANQEYTKQFYG